MLVMPDLEEVVFEHLATLVTELTSKGTRIPAPVTVRTYLRAMNPSLSGATAEGYKASSVDTLNALGFICGIVARFRSEFHSGTDVTRLMPTTALIAAIAALQVSRRVANNVRVTKVVPTKKGVDEVLEKLLEDALLQAVNNTEEVKSSIKRIADAISSCPSGSGSGGGIVSAAVAKGLAQQLEALFDEDEVQRRLSEYLGPAWEALGPSFLQACERDVLRAGNVQLPDDQVRFGAFLPKPTAAPSRRAARGTSTAAAPSAAPVPQAGPPAPVEPAAAPAAVPVHTQSPAPKAKHTRATTAAAAANKAAAEEAPSTAASPGAAAKSGVGKRLRSAKQEQEQMAAAAPESGQAVQEAEAVPEAEEQQQPQEPAQSGRGRRKGKAKKAVQHKGAEAADAGGTEEGDGAPAEGHGAAADGPTSPAAARQQGAAAATPRMSGRNITGPGAGRRGRELRWDSPTPQPAALAPEGGSPGIKRRKVCRWSPEETDLFIKLVYTHGVGNWKAVMEAAGDDLNHRTQVDLKDKWRNLENSGKVLRDRVDQLRAIGLLDPLGGQQAPRRSGRRRRGGDEDGDDGWETKVAAAEEVQSAQKGGGKKGRGSKKRGRMQARPADKEGE